ncbi:MAG: hypothetical protein H0W07_09790 [Chloroflexi bacterium]|nr:hypothetical protein [Chloroflexota bacterium]
MTETVDFQTVELGGWPGCIRLANEQIELVATTDVGPRIIRLSFLGGRNLFKTFAETLGQTGGDEWHSYGGHRLWHAPEVMPRTYAPDNGPVEHSWDGATLTLRSEEPANGLAKELQITLSRTEPRVEVLHRITNRNAWSVELAPWALSVMAPGGRAVVPQEEHFPHPDVLRPARPVVLWHFTDMSDPRWTWGRRYLQLRQDPSATTKQKAGVRNTRGWSAYMLDGVAFIKRYAFAPDATYPDMGCNTELFTDPEMLEVETLGPLTRLAPGSAVDHVESWTLARVAPAVTDDELDRVLLPLLAG